MTAIDRFAPGDRVGNYRIERERGPTGAGLAYAAVHLVLPRRAIVKVMHAAVASHRPFALQLLREACILEAIAGAGLPRVYDSGLISDRRPWFAIEDVTADHVETLADRMIVAGPLAIADVARIVGDLAQIVEHAHRRGVTIRGLRPDRIALAPHRELSLCIVDWSDARTHDAAGRIPHLPAPGARPYLAPEQLRGEADDRVDVFALGTITHQLLYAAFPHTHDPLARPDVPAALVVLVEQMIARDRFDRPSITEVRARLRDSLPPRPTLPSIRRPRWTPALGQPTIADDVVEVVDIILDEPTA